MSQGSGGSKHGVLKGGNQERPHLWEPKKTASVEVPPVDPYWEEEKAQRKEEKKGKKSIVLGFTEDEGKGGDEN